MRPCSSDTRATRLWPADLYLEGSDQHRGWFQSSLWTSIVALRQRSLSGAADPRLHRRRRAEEAQQEQHLPKAANRDAYMAEYGADVIRLWIASQDFRDDTPISKEILSHVGETYRLIRNTLRYQLSNLFDFEAARDAVPVEQMDTLDRWALGQTAVVDSRLHGRLRELRVPPRLSALQSFLLRHAFGDVSRHPEGPAVHAGHELAAAALLADRASSHFPIAGQAARAGPGVYDRRGMELRDIEFRIHGRFDSPAGMAGRASNVERSDHRERHRDAA